MKYAIKPLIVAILLATALLGLSRGSAYTDETLESKILEIVATDQGVALQGLQIGALEPAIFPLTGVTLYRAKVVDTTTGQIYGVVVDQSGEAQTLEDARLAERAAYDARYGRLDPALCDLLQTMADDDRLTVAIWLRADDLVPPSRPDLGHQPSEVEAGDAEPPPPEPGPPQPPDSLQEKTDQDMEEALATRVEAIRAQQAEQRAATDDARQANADHLEDQMTALQGPLLADLEVQGFEPTYVSPIAPVVYVEVPKSAILALAERTDVHTVYGPTEYFDVMNTAKPTQKADVVDGWGFDGSGIDVAILEDSRIEFNNPYLNLGTTRVPGDPNVDEHATATAGMVASQHSTYQGIAQGVYLYSANATDYGDANLSAAMDWAAWTQNVDIINNSYGGNAGNTNLNVHDRHLDYIVRYGYSTVTVAAGNEADGCETGTGRVTSPARGYNIISVGNFADQNTLTWDDDAMNACSSYVDPSTGIEKPEVAGSGSSIISTLHQTPWIGNVGSGTSYSAPMVAGEAALLMDRNSSLAVYPEAVKAIIMATALNNIEGSSRLSEIDGAGGVDMRAAFRVVDEGWWDWRSVGSGSFPYNLYVYAFAGETVRAAIAWDSKPNASYTSDPLEADIDLRVYDPGGSYVTGSTSVPNSFEIVEFTASTTGNYRLEIDDWRFDGTTEYIGAAWWPGHRVLTAYAPQVLGTPPVSRDYYRFNAATYWNAVGIRSPSGGDYDIYLYADSAFGDPADHDWLEDSTTAWTVDYVVVDRNHAPSGNYYPEVRTYSGSGNYSIEWATRSADTVGTYGPYTMAPSQVVRVWDSYLTAGVRKYFAVKPTSGNADLGMALHDSDPASSSSWYQGASQRVAYADSAGSGGSEYMNYQTSTTDWMGLVVWDNGATTTTSFYLHTDTTAATGSIVINGGAAYATSTSVNLTLSASDGQTSVSEMRFSNNGSSWSAWEPYATSKSWTLTSGSGAKTVYVQYKNNAGMVSSSYSDAIILLAERIYLPLVLKAY